MKKKVIIAGNLIVDTIKKINEYPQKNMLATIEETFRSVGGCVPNVSIDLKKLDSEIEIETIGKIGDDSDGRYLIEKLNQFGIDTKFIKKDNTRCTSFTDVMTQRNGERTFFQYRGANDNLCIEDFPLEEISCDFFHIGYALLLNSLDEKDEEFGTKMARLLYSVQKRGIKTCLDVVSDTSDRFKTVVIPALKYCNYAILNETEAGLIADIMPRKKSGEIDEKKLLEIAEKFVSYGVKDMVIIHCPEMGVCLNVHTNGFFIIPSLNLPSKYIKGSVGAGDAFCAGCIYSILNDKKEEDILKIASCVAAQNLSFNDSIGGATTIIETMKLENKFSRKSK